MNRLYPLIFALFTSTIWGQVELTDSALKDSERLESYADSCFANGDITSAKTVYTRIVKLWDSCGIHNETYAKNLYNLSLCMYKTGDYSEAIALGKEALERQKQILGEEHSDYILSLNNLATNYAELGDYSEAIKIGEEAMRIEKKKLDINQISYATTLNLLAWSYSCIDNNSEAIKLVSEALKIRKIILGTNHPDYATSLSNLALYKFNLGSISEAINLELEAKEIRKNSIGRKHRDYAISLDNLASYNSYIGNYTEALNLSSEALEIRKTVLGKKHDEYAISLNNMATINANLGNYQEAVKLEEEAIDVLKQKKDSTIFYIGFTNVFCALNNILGKYEEVINLSKEISTIIGKKFGYENSMYATALENMAESYFKLGKHNMAIDLATKAANIRKTAQGENHPDYAYSLYCISTFYFDMGDYNKSVHLSSEALNIIKQNCMENSIDYAGLLLCLAKNHFALKNQILASKELATLINTKSRSLLSNFSCLPSYRRRRLWDIENSFYLVDIPKFAFYIQDPNLISLTYDSSALLAKGILLNTEIEIKNLINESGDSDLNFAYKSLLSARETYEKQSSVPIGSRCIDIDSLSQVIQKEEDELVRKSKAYGDYTKNLSLTWKDIQSQLKDSDIAIEFIDFPITEDSTMYVALTLKKGYDNPRMIPLFEINQLKKINENTFYRTSRLAKLIWEPLKEELEGVTSIYFSPSGELHKIGIEYLPLNGEEYIFDRYKMTRLSSTRQLVTKKENNHQKRAVIYGGIDYDAPLFISSSSAEPITKNYKSNHLQIDSLSIRGGRDYLEGTKKEADSISSNLERHNWDCAYYLGDRGTENNFKMMSGISPSLLHIATHGFYMTEKDAQKEQELALLESGNMQLEKHTKYREDKPMTRSGLLLSGCNHTLNYEDISGYEEDGILTAQEIALLDLRGLDLVVLSACETGLGDISSGEGVFGLQRGFKKAGANTIIMSLWKVSDKATEKLMTAFYSYYLNGMSKYDAFTTAREELRKTCPPRQNRPDWAAFIMLDGIN